MGAQISKKTQKEKNMSEAMIAAKEPAVLDLEPRSFEITGKQTVALCQCKYTNNSPFCDGTHEGL